MTGKEWSYFLPPGDISVRLDGSMKQSVVKVRSDTSEGTGKVNYLFLQCPTYITSCTDTALESTAQHIMCIPATSSPHAYSVSSGK